MPVIDDRGRLFGKVNLIDALVGLLVLGLIPLAYGALLLFRVPAPKITSITPTEFVEHQTVTLQITGEEIRPFLRAQLGSQQAEAFLVQSPERAEIKLPDLAAGTYDLVLFDEAQELLRVPNALTVIPEPPPPPPPPPPPTPQIELQAIGAFDLDVDDVPLIRVGLQLRRANEAPTAEVLAIGSPEAGTYRVRVGADIVSVPKSGSALVPAILRVKCFVEVENDGCSIGDVALAPDARVVLPLWVADTERKADRPAKDLSFVVEDVQPAGSPVAFPSSLIDVQVVGWFIGLSESDARQIRVGLRLEGGQDEPSAEVLAVQEPVAGTRRVRSGGTTRILTPVSGELVVAAILRLRCVITPNEECQVGGTTATPNATITLPIRAGVKDERFFRIDEIRPAGSRLEFLSIKSSLIDVQVVGWFIGLSESDARQIRVGLRLEGGQDEPSAEVLAVQEPVAGTRRVRSGGTTRILTPVSGELVVAAILRLRCVITPNEECQVGGTTATPNATITLPIRAGVKDERFFRIDEIRPAGSRLEFLSIKKAVATLRVRFVAAEEILDLMKVGDVDVGTSGRPVDEGALLTALDAEREPISALTGTTAAFGRTYDFQQDVLAFTGTVRVPVVYTPSGWQYKARSVKVGAPFSFETVSGFMDGRILDMAVDNEVDVPAVR